MLERLVAALNSITTQAWAYLILLTGIASALLFHRAGIAVDIAAGVIGTAINMFTAQAKASPTTPQQSTPPNPMLPGTDPAQPPTK